MLREQQPEAGQSEESQLSVPLCSDELGYTLGRFLGSFARGFAEVQGLRPTIDPLERLRELTEEMANACDEAEEAEAPSA